MPFALFCFVFLFFVFLLKALFVRFIYLFMLIFPGVFTYFEYCMVSHCMKILQFIML